MFNVHVHKVKKKSNAISELDCNLEGEHLVFSRVYPSYKINIVTTVACEFALTNRHIMMDQRLFDMSI